MTDWWFECRTHSGASAPCTTDTSIREVYHLAIIRPLPPENPFFSHPSTTSIALNYLRNHPTCTLNLVSFNGDVIHIPAPGPSSEPMAIEPNALAHALDRAEMLETRLLQVNEQYSDLVDFVRELEDGAGKKAQETRNLQHKIDVALKDVISWRHDWLVASDRATMLGNRIDILVDEVSHAVESGSNVSDVLTSLGSSDMNSAEILNYVRLKTEIKYLYMAYDMIDDIVYPEQGSTIIEMCLDELRQHIHKSEILSAQMWKTL